MGQSQQAELCHVNIRDWLGLVPKRKGHVTSFFLNGPFGHCLSVRIGDTLKSMLGMRRNSNSRSPQDTGPLPLKLQHSKGVKEMELILFT